MPLAKLRPSQMRPMSQAPTLQRWRAALSQAARGTLLDRWRATADAFGGARREYRALYPAPAAPVDVRALRKAAQRVHDLGQLRAVLARELATSRV
jgi:hypothetical protein